MSENDTSEPSRKDKGLTGHFKLPDRLRSTWLSRLFRRGKTAPILEFHEEPLQAPEIHLETKIESDTRKLHIGTSFIESLKASGIIFPATDEFEEVGVAAVGGTNENGDPYLFESIRKSEKPPNGYLIGIGAGNVFSMLEAFPEDITPKAIILFDVDPEVVKFGEKLIKSLKENPDKLPIEVGYLEKIKPIVFHVYGDADPKAAIVKHVRKLAQLAQEGNLVIVQADFNNPQIPEQVAHLPDFKVSNNVVYLSNIADHLWRRNYLSDRDYVPDFSFLYSLAPEPPNQNYYIYTLSVGLRYKLRIDTEPTKITRQDFDPRLASLNWQVYPHDRLLYPNQPDPVWEDISSWDIEKIKDAYRQLFQKPSHQERIKIVEERINDMRQYKFKHYPEDKEKAKLGVFKEHRTYFKYVVPKTKEEEQRLLEELQQPYDYQRDLLPFVATNFWGNAQTPLQIYSSALPKRQTYHRSGDVLYSQEDPRDWTKGKVELWLLERNITYEEVALAKLYREVGQRVKDKNSQADIKGKNFDELLEVLAA